ncbi:Wadjet anti-phage system protein JetD domain-containing protein [Nocardia brasiliensis]|uniref:Wadjet anti-phage system protein JetD domain-containing protein n=1 Tax=Nocardia brasiliensis TaxID=37326 RepID=UPI002458CF5F|nr:Wadjet anti-phage system protein JetD domain-containing protein [Nocardia brasiliensis]
MKSPDVVLEQIRSRLENYWHTDIVSNGETHWPHELPLGHPTSEALTRRFPEVQQWALEWHEWAQKRQLDLRLQNRSVHGTRQPLPSHITIPNIDTAARLVGNPWPRLLHTARHRTDQLAAQFPDIDPCTILRDIQPLDDTDFELLCHSAEWFRTNDATGLTPRQVPLEGLHGKWLNNHHSLIRRLCGKVDLGLVSRPTRVHLTYLDPTHLETGHRKHDSMTLGDTATPQYTPEVVIILENKDTAVYFPEINRGIAIEGEGFKGPSALTRLHWLAACPRLYYWGDIDAAGYEIVHRFRSGGLDIVTLLMDDNAYSTYERYGASVDERGRPIPCAKRKPLPRLNEAERAVYDRITHPDCRGPRRIEQERIPLEVAHAAVLESLGR